MFFSLLCDFCFVSVSLFFYLCFFCWQIVATVEDVIISYFSAGGPAGPKAWTAPLPYWILGGATLALGLSHPLFAWNLRGRPKPGGPFRPLTPALEDMITVSRVQCHSNHVKFYPLTSRLRLHLLFDCLGCVLPRYSNLITIWVDLLLKQFLWCRLCHSGKNTTNVNEKVLSLCLFLSHLFWNIP